MRTKKTKTDTRNRALWIALLLFTWMILIIWRLGWLQLIQHEHYLAKAARNQQKELATVPPRGAIVDRNGKDLAFTVISNSAYVDLKLLKRDEDRQKAAQLLAPLLNLNESEILKRLTGSSSFVWLKRKLDPETSRVIQRAIEENKLSGVALKQETSRFYPNDSLASHLIGYVSAEDKGQAGLEQTHDVQLRGLPGEIDLLKDAQGRAFDRRDTPAATGARLVTTIDSVLQHKVEVLLDEAFKWSKAKSASAIVLDPSNGEILALANVPTFNPNERPKTAPKTADDLARHNRVISFPYEPGSIFKIVTYSAAFELGLVKPDDMINCGNGQITIGSRIIHDTHSYGLLSVADAFAKSSNVGAIKIAQKVGKERLYEFIDLFGFGKKTGIELPGESRGIVNALDDWRPDSIGSVAIGQEISVTLLQAAAAMSSIANKGVWVQPHVVKKIVADNDRVLFETSPESRRVISEETARKMTGILERVVTHGTARNAIQLAGYTAAGKTGTPQKVEEQTGRYSKTKYMPSFAGFVPATNPRFVIIVMLDEPVGLYHGGSVAAPVFNKIAETALGDFVVSPDEKTFRESLIKLSKKYEQERSDEPVIAGAEQMPVATPTPAPIVAKAAAVKLEDKKTEAQNSKPAANVSLNISPYSRKKPDAPRSENRTENRRDENAVTGVMPDLRGRGVRAVMQMCNELSLDVRLRGSGVAVRQNPAAGARVRAGDECRVEFQ